MAAIKRFFEKKKLEMKFKKAGEGHKLTEDTRASTSGRAVAGSSAGARRDPTQDSRMAGAAALQRMNQPKPGEWYPHCRLALSRHCILKFILTGIFPTFVFNCVWRNVDILEQIYFLLLLHQEVHWEPVQVV